MKKDRDFREKSDAVRRGKGFVGQRGGDETLTPQQIALRKEKGTSLILTVRGPSANRPECHEPLGRSRSIGRGHPLLGTRETWAAPFEPRQVLHDAASPAPQRKLSDGIKFSQEVRPERVTTNRASILYQIITITSLAPRRRPPLIILSLCSVYLEHDTPLPVHQSQIVVSSIYIVPMPPSPSPSTAQSALGFYMSGYC